MVVMTAIDQRRKESIVNSSPRTLIIAGSLISGFLFITSCGSEPKADARESDSGSTTEQSPDETKNESDSGSAQHITVEVLDASANSDIASATDANPSTSFATQSSSLDAGVSSGLEVDADDASLAASLVDAGLDASPGSDAGELEPDGGE